MNGRAARLAAVVRADFLIRLRRPSTAVVFVLLAAMPYFWIPDPATHRALMQFGGRRALYNSAAIGMSTATIATIFIGLFGFYVISNALRRDVLSRCGYVIASTTMRGSEYLLGKFLGNVTFLTVFTAGFMTTSMAMVLVRGEAPLEPLVFMKQYLLLLPPAITFVSAVSLVFEATPLLWTKFGDVLYFFLWVGCLGAVASTMEHGGPSWLVYLDYSGMGFVMQQLRTLYGTSSMSIGASPWDPSKGVVEFKGLSAAGPWLVQRLVATVWPVALLAIARLFFHRFDPARVRAMPNEKARRSWFGRLNLLAKPVARVIARGGEAAASAVSGVPFLRAAVADAATSTAAFPLITIGAIGFAIAALAADDAKELFKGILPLAFAAMAVAVSDVASRDKRSGTLALVFAAPQLRLRFVLWKFASSLVVGAAFLAVPLACAIASRPSATAALLNGLVFIVAGATALGVVASNPKAFLVLFLTFWYLVNSDAGHTAAMNFAGWFGPVPLTVLASYAVTSLVMLVAAHLFHRRDLARRW